MTSEAHVWATCEQCHQPIMSDQTYSMDGDRRHWPECPAMTVANRELVDADTDEILGEATVEQAAASDEAAKLDGGAGIILIDEVGRVVPPDQEHQPWIGPTRRVYAAEPSEVEADDPSLIVRVEEG